MVEVRNQARVHLWFEAKFGEPYTPLCCTAEALERLPRRHSRSARASKAMIDSTSKPRSAEDLFALRLRQSTPPYAPLRADCRRCPPPLARTRDRGQ
jgi:hypothetical protein